MKLIVMKKLKALLFTTILAIGCCLFVFGQQSDDKKNDPPPKDKPPTIKVEPKETPRPTPTPKKPDDAD